MSKKILFSPVGGTDPIRYFHDGSMLHICRWYKPDVVYLYMSHEMMETHRKDDRYRYAICRLGEQLGHEFEIHLIERDELIDVQEYDTFYVDFRQEIRKIMEQMEDGDSLLLNMASGTPAMKSALLVLATIAEYRYLPIQVSTPQKKINSARDEWDEFGKEEIWDMDEDNGADAENRCKEIICHNLNTLLRIDMIKKHLNAYDYHAAVSVAEELKDKISEDAYMLLQAADARVKLDERRVAKLLQGKKYNLFPIKESDKKKVFEYALVLQRELEREEYANFIRGVTPIVMDLLESILKKQCGIKLDDFCRSDKKGVLAWNEDKLKKNGLWDILNAAYKNAFHGGVVYAGHINVIIQEKCTDMAIKQRAEEIVTVEHQVRNVAAHEIVSVSDEWFRKKTGKSAREIFNIIKYLAGMAGIRAKEEDWRSYDAMNRLIQDLLDIPEAAL